MIHPQLSIVIPAYNEGARIEQTLRQVMQCIEEQGWDAEVLVVDDGSLDETAMIVRRFMGQYSRLHLIQNGVNRGKGYAVRNGLLQAEGDLIMFTDADLSSPMEEAVRLLAALHSGYDIAIGSKWMDRTRQTHHQPLYRRFFGRCFNWTTRFVMALPFKDTQCGFKAFRRPAAQAILRLQTVEGWGFDPELLFIARKLRYSVLEVPVISWHDDRSKLNYLEDGWKMLKDLATIRFNSFAGRYDEATAATRDLSSMLTPRTALQTVAGEGERELGGVSAVGVSTGGVSAGGKAGQARLPELPSYRDADRVFGSLAGAWSRLPESGQGGGGIFPAL